jgi:hypothetical protein
MQARAPTLSPGDIVIMDNLGSHKVAGVREAIAASPVPLIPMLDRLRIEEQPLPCRHAVTALSLLLHR